MIRKEKDGWKIDFSGEKPPTPLLDTINYPVHMKNLSTEVHDSASQWIVCVCGLISLQLVECFLGFCFF